LSAAVRNLPSYARVSFKASSMLCSGSRSGSSFYPMVSLAYLEKRREIQEPVLDILVGTSGHHEN